MGLGCMGDVCVWSSFCHRRPYSQPSRISYFTSLSSSTDKKQTLNHSCLGSVWVFSVDTTGEDPHRSYWDGQTWVASVSVSLMYMS